MNFIIDFYKDLSTLDLIIFWGVIIVVILLLVFSIIIVRKNKKLKKLIPTQIKEENNIPIKEEISKPEENKIEEPTITEKKSIKEEPNFIAEEHIQAYNKDLFSLSNIKKTGEYTEEKTNYDESLKEVVDKMPTKPYQRNVLRSMSLNQTSPIGIVKQKTESEKEQNKIEELSNNLKEIKDESTTIFPKLNNIEEKSKPKENLLEDKIEKPAAPKAEPAKKEEIVENKEIISEKKNDLKQEEKTPEKNDEYLKEVSKKLSESKGLDDIDRTEYELQQEEDAIISYEELMQKKDSIQMVDEEEAVISISELMDKQNKDKLYKLTEEEQNDDFIDELKKFRNDL